MAKKRITKKQMIKKKGKVLNTKWINNAMRSVGSISATVFKDMAPTVFETGKEISFAPDKESKPPACSN